MGATDFGTARVTKTPKEAYKKAVEEASYEYGNNSYNGTISTTNGYYFFDKHPRWGTKAFDKWEDKILSDDNSPIEKWGKCGCIEITGKAAKEIKEVNGLKGKRGLKVWYFFGWVAC